jgi:hypothetical protein
MGTEGNKVVMDLDGHQDPLHYYQIGALCWVRIRKGFCSEAFGRASSHSDDEPSGEYALHYKSSYRAMP